MVDGGDLSALLATSPNRVLQGMVSTVIINAALGYYMFNLKAVTASE